MAHFIAARHIDIIRCLRHVGQTGYQLLRELQGLLHAVIIQRRGHIGRGMVFHVSPCGEEENRYLLCHERRMVARPVPIRNARDVQMLLSGYLLHHGLEAAACPCARHTHGIAAHTSHHIQVHHGDKTFVAGREVDAAGVVLLHPVQEEL